MFALISAGCVGGIKEDESEVPIDNSSLIADPTFTFQGISYAEAISDSKINIHFPPASMIDGSSLSQEAASEGSTAVLFTYKVTRDGSDVSIGNFVDSNLSVNAEGNYVVTINSNGRGDCGTYNVTAIRSSNTESRSGVNYFRVCSFNDYYPSFDGVLAMQERTGCDIYNGARITWRVAEKSPELSTEIARYDALKIENLTKFSQGDIDSTIFTANNTAYDAALAVLAEYSPESYYVFYNATEEELLARLNDDAAVPNATITNASTTYYNVDGLTGGETYYFAVRAATSLITSSAKKNVEANTHIVSFTVPKLQPISFAGITSVGIPTNADGYNSATIRYAACTGCDSYRYYAKDNSLPLDYDNDTPKAILDLASVGNNPTSYTLTALEKHKTYYFYAVGVNDCSNGGTPEIAGQNVYRTKTTTPPLAPFNGVSGITTVGGALDRLMLNWSLPDATAGVYDEYKIYQTDSDGNVLRTLSNTPHATNPYINPIDDVTDPSRQTATILNLDAGDDQMHPNEYCFIVVPKESDFNGPFGIGREPNTTDRVVACKDFYYQAPNFAGPLAGNCNSTSNSFEVRFPVPTEGTYSQFRLYYKVDEGETLIDYDVAEADTATVVQGKGVGAQYTRIEFNYDSLATPSVTPPVFAGNVSVNPFRITGLTPDVTYIFAMETYYDPDGGGAATPFYVRPSILRSCKTTRPDVVHDGWEHIMSLGKKTNGLNGGSTIKEKLSQQTIDALDYLSSGAAIENPITYNSEKLSWWYMEEDSSANDTAGHVFLSWFDYKMSGSGTYANSLVGTGSTMEYVITRSLNSNMSGATELTTIPLESGIFLYHYVDENITTGSTRYYYKINLRVDGIDLQFASSAPAEKAINDANAILEVIVPPANMAYVHKYMFNKHQCTRLDTTIPHYVHALPDVDEPDTSHDDLIDWNVLTGYQIRNVKGAFFNSPTHKNYDIANNYRCLYNGLGSSYDSVVGDYFFDIGKSFLVDRFEAGTKIGLVGTNPCEGDGNGPYNCISEYTTYRGVAAKNTVWYQTGNNNDTDTWAGRAYNADIYINTSISTPTNTWTKLRDMSAATLSPISHLVFSNEAYLPPARTREPAHAKTYCSNRSITVGSDTYTGRLGSRQEFIVLGGWHDQLAPIDVKQVANRIDYTGNRVNFGCNSNYTNAAVMVPRQSISGLPPDITQNNYPSRNSNPTTDSDYDLHLLRTGSYSSDYATHHSSHLCFSKFGLQDFVGNEIEVTDDWFVSVGGEFKLDLTKTPDEIKPYWLNTVLAPLSPMLPSQNDYYNQYMLNFRYDNAGTPVMTTLTGRYLIGDDHRLFYNPLAGLRFACHTPDWLDGTGVAWDTNWGTPPNPTTNYCYNESTTNFNALRGQSDWMNQMYSNYENYENPGSGIIGYPRALRYETDFIPYYYEHIQAYVQFPRDVYPRPLTVGGMGYQPYYWEMGNGTTRNGVYSSGYAPVQVSEWPTKVGFRCVFTVD